MLLKHPFVTLKRENMSPCILRIDKIKHIRDLPGGRSEIEYKSWAETVRGNKDEVMMEIRKACGKQGFKKCPFVPDWEEDCMEDE